MKKNLTYHASIERNDRLNFIVEYIGIGEEFCVCPHETDPTKEEVLTTTGVLVVRNIKTHMIITMFPCGMPKACVVYKRAMRYDGARLPRSMVEKINYNTKLEKKFHIGG